MSGVALYSWVLDEEQGVGERGSDPSSKVGGGWGKDSKKFLTPYTSLVFMGRIQVT